MISLTRLNFFFFQPILWLCFFATAIFAHANAVAAGMAISKVANSTDQTISDARIDAVRCQAFWNEFQPTSSLDADTSVFEDCISAASANGKLSILQLDFAPDDTGSGEVAVPQWAVTMGARVVSDPASNEFPVWWNPTYQTFAKAAITKLTGIYNSDTRVAGYLTTGYSGVLPTSLAGEQSDALCDNFQAEGYNGVCPPSGLGDDNLIAEGGVYGIAVRAMMTHWAISTTKTLVYVARNPVQAGTLTEELEANPVGLYTHIAVVNNGLNQCDGQNDIIPRFVALQAAGHIVGWYGISPNGFTTDTIASGIVCAAGGLDVSKLWITFTSNTWVNNDDALQASYGVFHPTDTKVPSAPKTLLATAVSSSQINLSWTPSTDNVVVAGYKVYRNGVQVATAMTPSYSDTNLYEAATYNYTVFAYDAAGNKSWTAAKSARTLDATAPSKPTNLSLTVISGTQINLTWTAPTDNVGVTGYKIYRNGVQVATTTTASYSNIGLAQATTYTYTVAAYDAAGNTSPQSASKTATTLDAILPSKPTGLVTTGIFSSKITLAWNPSTDNVGVVSYDVYRNGIYIATAKSTTYTNKLLSHATTYTYTVAAKDAAGNTSLQSNPLTVTTLP